MKKIILASIIPLFIQANTVFAPVENNALDLTLYKDGGMVHLEKSLSFSKVGSQKLIIPNIPYSVDVGSVNPVFEGLKVIKNYIKKGSYTNEVEDLLRLYINKNVTYIQNGVEYSGKLISVNPTIVKNEDLNQISIVRDNSSIKLEDINNNGMLIGDNLIIDIDTEEPGKSRLSMDYRTGGVSWKANYAISLKTENTMDFQSWIEIKNDTNVNFENANLYVVSGDIKNVKNKKPYTLFNLKKKTDIEAKEVTYVDYISSSNVKYRKYGISEFKHGKGDHGTVSFSFDGIIEFDNIKEKGLGQVLPAGKISVYEKDNIGKMHLTGEDTIGLTDKFKSVRIKTGEMDKVFGTVFMKKYSMSKNHEKGIQEFIFKNKTNNYLELRFRIIHVKYGNYTAKDTCSGECSYSNIQNNIKEYIIHLKAHGEYSFRRTFDVYY